MEKREVLKIFFNNSVSPKSLKKFYNKTPKGNFVSGWICLEPGEFLSSMVLTEIKTEKKVIKCNRFLRGMPKQHYYDKETWGLFQDDTFTIYQCYEKLDGTCLMLYTLYDEEDNLIEIVPRTRGMAVASNHILDMYNLIDKAQIKDFYSHPHNYDTVLMFELYGILNRHEITDYKHYIDIKLIGATLESEVLSRNSVFNISYNSCFSIPDRLFDLVCYEGQWQIWYNPSKLYPYYLDASIDLDQKYDSLEDCILALENIMETINNNYKKQNNHIAIEGVVINGLDQDGNQRYVKIKPKSVFKMAKLGNGIPSYFIRKEIYKYFDEYNGALGVKEIYNNNSLHFLNFVKKNLLEEFPEEVVNTSKTEKKITNIFFSIWESKTPDLTIQNVAQELAEKYPDKSRSEIMKIFAQEYPSLKNKSKSVYSVLKYLVK